MFTFASTRRHLPLRRMLLAAALLASAGLHAQTAYPSRPVRIIVGFPAGTG
ncbi:MAG: hypothetical protein JWQ88_1259, partial [Rhodoferax sp.]|nr:hypothetical protein [Rhodoferax sp.]